MRLRRGLLLSTIFCSTALLFAAETPIPEPPTQWVTDTANMMSPAAVTSLNARLSAYEQATGHQLIVYIAPTTGDDPLDDWAVRAFKKWQVGRKGLDDGLVLFIMAQDHKMRIEVGYGLEAVVPDAIASRIINEVLAPAIQKGHPDEAVTAAIDALTGVIGAQPDANSSTQSRPQAKPMGLGEMILLGIGGILFLILAITHPGLAFYFLATMLSGGGGGGGSGGGGFSGGGGRSGGGGASGSW